MPRFAIVDRLTPAQRRRAAAETYHVDPDGACLNAAGRCPLAVALGLSGSVSQIRVADELAPPRAWESPTWHAVSDEAFEFIDWIDSGPLGEDKTEAVRAVMLAGLEDGDDAAV